LRHRRLIAAAWAMVTLYFYCQSAQAEDIFHFTTFFLSNFVSFGKRLWLAGFAVLIMQCRRRRSSSSDERLCDISKRIFAWETCTHITAIESLFHGLFMLLIPSTNSNKTQKGRQRESRAYNQKVAAATVQKLMEIRWRSKSTAAATSK